MDDTPFQIVERKVLVIDTLCDTIAKRCLKHTLSTAERYSIILRHMVDKIALSSGAAKVNLAVVRSEASQTVSQLPIHSDISAGNSLPRIVKDVVYQHFGEVYLLDLDQWLTIVDNTHFAPGPGVVYDADGSTQNERKFFFEFLKRVCGFLTTVCDQTTPQPQ